MQAWDVITHGGGEGLFYTFNAVAAFFNGRTAGDSIGSLAATLTTISATFASALAIFTMVIKQDIKISFNWLFSSFIIMNLLMIPKVNVLIIDRVTGFQRPVANVPFMLGAFAGATSQLGDAMAKKMDDIFSGPIMNDHNMAGQEVMNYRMHGVAMASQLVSKASRFTVTDPDMAANLREFVQQCVVIDIAKGKYSISSLMESKDVWGMLKDNASPARGFPYRNIDNKAIETKILTCQEGAAKLDIAWNNSINKAKKIYGSRFFPNSKNPANALMSNMSISYGYLTNISSEASEILRQNMMINALEDGLLSANQVNNASAAVTGYATTRAQEQQKTAYALQGSMASLSLSVLKIVVEVMFYAIFPIIAIIAVLPGGVAVLKKYVVALFWIQSWAPLYSVLNMLVNIYGRSKSMAAIAGTSAYGVSAATLPGLVEGNEWVAAVAGYTMMSVPFLSYGLIHYGAGAFSQLSTHFGSVTQSAASHAAEEATTGNYNMGNTSFDNHSRHNISGFKQDQNLSVATGRSSVQMANGSWVSTTMDGSVVVDQGAAISKIGGNINYAENMSQSLSEAADSSHRSGLQHTTAAQENLSSAIVEGLNHAKSRSNGMSSDMSSSRGEVYSENDSFSQLLEETKNYAKQHNVSDSVAASAVAKAELTARASIEGGVGFFSVARASGSVGIGGSIEASNSSSRSKGELETKSDNLSERDNLGSVRSNTFNESNDARFNQNQSSSSSYSDSINASLSKVDSHMKSASASYGEEQQYRESAQQVSSNSAGFNQDMSQQYVNHLLNNTEAGRRNGISGAKAIIDNPELNQQHLSSFLKEKAQSMHSNLWHKENNLSNLKQTYDSNANKINNNQSIKENYQSNTGHLNHLKNTVKLNNPVENSTLSNHSEHRDNLNTTMEDKKLEIKNEKDNKTKNFDSKHEKLL